jgi:phytanoyl-CoA hydroxylase
MSGTLGPSQITQFHQDGYLLLRRRVAADVCARMQDVTRRHLAAQMAPVEYEAEVGYAGAPASLDAAGGRTVRRLRNAWQRDPAFQRWASEPALLADLQALLGEPACLTLAHHNCIMTKHPDFGTATGWHRDIRYWSFARPDLISVWLALGPENPDNGGLHFIPGSHRLQIDAAQLDELDFLRPDAAANQPLFARGITLDLQAGDVVLFHSGLFHAAGRNQSHDIKSSVVFAYHGLSNGALPGSRSAAAGTICFEPARAC